VTDHHFRLPGSLLTLILLAAAELVAQDPGPSRALDTAAIAALDELRDGVTVSGWLKAHPGESAELYTPSPQWPDMAAWCVRFSRRTELPLGRTFVRHAFFFPPEWHSGQQLPPASDSSGLISRECHLGVIWLELEERDTTAGDSLAAHLRGTLARRWPPEQKADPRLARWPSWRVGGAWRNGPTLVETAFRIQPERPENLSAKPGGQIVAVRSFPFALDEPWRCYPECPLLDLEPARTIDSGVSAIREAARLSGVAPARLAPVLQLLGETRARVSAATSNVKPASAARLAGTLQRLLAPTGGTSRERAARLFIADRLLTLSVPSAGPDEGERVKPLIALGAEFARIGLEEDGYTYRNNWRTQAYNLDRYGPIGSLALSSMLEENFFASGRCTADGFADVIRQVEPLLATGEIGTAAARFALADAYRDVLTLASGGGSESFDPDEVRRIAEQNDQAETRRRALAHYRAAFALDSTSDRARRSWPDAWRVTAGLPPTGTRYACTND
jgi:hypothetical protein